MIKRFITAAAVLSILAACSSGVDLDKVPVDERSGAPISTTNGGADASSTGQSGVKPVDLNSSAVDAAGPVGVSPTIYFDYDSYIIKPAYQAQIEGHARFLKESKARKVVIEGNTDQRGGSEYNLALGQKRAEAVRRALVLLGVPDNQMEAISFGKEKPAAQGMTEDAFAQNRRAEMSYR